MVQELSGGAPSANLLTGLGPDETFARSDVNGLLSPIVDGTNSTIALLDTAGVASTQYSYEPFGRSTTSGAASSNSFQFTGRENDGTGLYFYRARYYSPNLQRFISEDPLGFGGGGVNLYEYVSGDPVSRIDPSGTQAAAVGAAVRLLPLIPPELLPNLLPNLDKTGKHIPGGWKCLDFFCESQEPEPDISPNLRLPAPPADWPTMGRKVPPRPQEKCEDQKDDEYCRKKTNEAIDLCLHLIGADIQGQLFRKCVRERMEEFGCYQRPFGGY